jgi:hypothetical protein
MPWTNEAIYNEFGFVGEDISRMLLNLSPFETPLLDALSAPPAPATNIAHLWEEHQLGPDTIIASAAVNSATAATGILINGMGNYLQAGMLLEVEVNAAGGTNEIVQITSAVGPNSILVSRNFASRGISSLVAGGTLSVMATALFEGADALGSVYRPPVRKTNYCHIFGKEVIVTGTASAVQFNPDRGSLMTFEAAKILKEVTRDLEKAVIKGAASGNSIGSASAYRTMDGLRALLTGINSVVVASSFTADPVGYLSSVWQSAYSAGARDIDLIVCGPQFKRDLSAVNAVKSYLFAGQDETKVQRVIDEVRTDFGSARVIVSPWMPSSALMGISTRRTFVVPLRGRQFGLAALAKTGDADKAQIVGEYTLECNRADLMFHLHI